MNQVNSISRLAIGPLQFLTRQLVRHGFVHHRIWRYIVAIREYYAQACPPIERETEYGDGIKILASLSNHIEAQIYWHGFQEADEGTVFWLKKLLPQDGVFIDIGANIGSFTLVAAKQASQGTVHAFEPSAYHYNRLSHNVDLNRFANVRLNKQGLFDKDTQTTLFVPGVSGEMNNSGAASIYKPSNASPTAMAAEEIDLIRLDDYVKTNQLNRIDVIKIDIEGAELKALAGATDTLKNFKPTVLMELDVENLGRAGYKPGDVLDFWEPLGYDVERILDASGLTAKITKADQLTAHQNILCKGRSVP